MNKRITTESDVVFDYPYEKQLYRLIMIYIHISGSQDGSGEKIIEDERFRQFCCCTSAELISAINHLVEKGFIHKRNYGLQLGKYASGYSVAVPHFLMEGKK